MIPEVKVQLGRIVITPEARSAVPPGRVQDCLARHEAGDFGCCCDEDAATNRRALAMGLRILSAFAIDPELPCEGFGDNCVWIITEADRSTTTVLLPSDY
jgi:hypothetical protein